MRRIAGGSSIVSDSSSVIPENGVGTYSFSAPDRLLDVQEAAALLNVPQSWIYQHVRTRARETLPHIKLGKYIRFSAQALMQWLETRQFGGDAPRVVGQASYFQRRR
jgi:excisionase family DNA binding protein